MCKRNALYAAVVTILLTVVHSIGFGQQSNKPASVNVTNPNINPLPGSYSPDTKLNTARVWSPTGPLTNYNDVLGGGYLDVKQHAEYFDGLGRPLQVVNRQVTPEGKDIVAPFLYDAAGRQTYEYLPYASTGTNGSFRLDPFSEQKAFMQGKYSDEQVYYSQTTYEASPLSRIIKTMAPGDNWAGSNRGITDKYLVNTAADAVRMWTITDNALTYIDNDNATNIPLSIGVYNADELYKNVTIDEGGNAVVEYRDREDKVVLRKVQVGDIAPDYTGYSGFLCTYYIYDYQNRIRFVIPPKAVAAIQPTWQLTSGIIDELCFRYEYDNRRRTIALQTPGAGWVYMIYDTRDRLVFSQDANLRKDHRWMTTMYDDLDRTVMTGITTWVGSPVDLQNIVTTQTASVIAPSGLTNDLVLPLPGQPVPISGTSQAYHSITLENGFISGNEFIAEVFGGSGLVSQESNVEGLLVNKNPVPTNATFTALTKLYYDGYGWTNIPYTASYNTHLEDGNNRHPVAPANAANMQVTGIVTGSSLRTIADPGNLAAGTWLTMVNYYDDRGRLVQSNSSNHQGGRDIVTLLYDYTGNVICTYRDQTNPGATPASLHIRTRMEYDHAGRLLEVRKAINDENNKEALIAKYEYDEMGQLKNKQVGLKKNNAGSYTAVPLERLAYSYNLRGWLTGINKDYANGLTPPTGENPWFGMELNYDKGFEKNQYTGNIAGSKWRSRGDDQKRAYGFTYDKANRLLGADFSQVGSAGYEDNSIVKYDMVMGDGLNGASAYDENGNITSMKHWGLKLNESVVIDDLLYSYFPNSNKLRSVSEQNTGTTDHKLGDFTDRNTSGDDYGYDENGNLITDLNKKLVGVTGVNKSSGGCIAYNHLNLPYLVPVKTETGAEKGAISYVYDAAGEKLKKITLEKAVVVRYNGVDYITDITTTTQYLTGCLYQSKVYSNSALAALGYTETLQSLVHEDGRVRYITTESGNPARFEYDYFIKDHLGNVRMVLTEENRTDIYQAGMEEANRDYEVALFGNKIQTAAVNKYGDFDSETDNKKVVVLNGTTDEGRVGPGVILKVMAGDKFKASTFAWYQPTGMDNTIDPGLPAILQNLLAQLVPGISGAGKGSTAAQITNAVLQPGMQNFLNNNQSASPGGPKAFLNWVLMDEEQFRKVDNAAGAVPVPVISAGQQKQLLQANSGNEIEITKNGYLYVFISNESRGNVYFDDIRVEHIRGSLIEETHYYPFGLTMTGISSKAPGRPRSMYKFNDGTEFNDDLGIDIYETYFRGYDAQIGRFGQADPMVERYPSWSPYTFAFNDPIYWNDPLGADPNILDIYNDLNNNGGGTWSPQGGYDFFRGNDASTFIAATSIMSQFNLWGKNGYANSFNDAKNAYYAAGGQDPMISQLLEPVVATGKYNRRGQWETWNWVSLMDQLKENGAEGFRSELDAFQGMLDVVGSSEIPIVSQVGDLASGIISGARGDFTGLALSVGGAVAPGLSQLKLARNLRRFGSTAIQRHHIIPNAVYKEFKKDLKAIKWVQNDAKNLKKLGIPFHGNHPAYNSRVIREINNLKTKGQFDLQSMKELQRTLRQEINDAYNSGANTLNNYYKDLGY